MLIGLACGCSGNVRLSASGYPSVFNCMQGHGMQRIKAVDCREWKVQCYTCQYARWCGASSENAWLLKTAHAAHHARHNVTAELQMNPKRADLIDMIYPRTVVRTVEAFKLPPGFESWGRKIETVEVPDAPLF